MRKLSKFFQLPGAERAALLHALALLWGVRLALWLLPFARVQRWALTRPPAERRGLPPPRLAWAVTAASRAVPRATCLTQALAGQVLFAHHGHRSQLHLGVTGGAGRAFEGHAWRTCAGRAVLGAAEARRFKALAAFETPEAQR